MKTRSLYILDILPLLYRAHFATMKMRFATSTGIDTRTTLVFFNYIFQVLIKHKPCAVAAVLDSRPRTRLTVSGTYKANRESMPDAIGEAFPYAMRLLEALRIPVFKKDGYEADDIIATIAKKAARLRYTVYIVSPDKDLAQLVNDRIFLFRPAYKGATLETLDAAGVEAKFGVTPSQIPDFLALKGDAVDNIPGVRGIGDKTAAALLRDHGSVEKLLNSLRQIKQQKIKAALTEAREQVKEAKRLTLLLKDVDIAVQWRELKMAAPDEKKLFRLLDELELVKIRERLIRLGFAGQTTASVQESAAEQIPVSTLSLSELSQQRPKAKPIAVGFLESADDRVFIYGEGIRRIGEVILRNESDWKQLIRSLGQTSQTVVCWEMKPLIKRLEAIGLSAGANWLDLQIAAYLLDPDNKIEWGLVRKKYELPDYSVPPPYAALGYLPALPAAWKLFSEKIGALRLSSLLFETELPLTAVLARMELQGIRIDLEALKQIEKSLCAQLDALEKNLYDMAGRKFSAGSPLQIAAILKDIAEPNELKRTKTGQISTAEPFLADIAAKYPFVEQLLKHRKLNKIITTYAQALPKYVHPSTGKIHPTFQQVVAGTGRLSCTNPNLQNLPVRNETGREVRKAVVPSGPGFSILGMDYNQVELRLLAALSRDETMTDAFRKNKDIHTITACKLFRVKEDGVTKEMRSMAKSVNFGIPYGITPWGLATRLKISQRESAEIIEAYFKEFPAVKEYLAQSIRETRERGFTRTVFGRIRYIDGIESRNATTRKSAERMAVNAPLQGLAADIIKKAMVAADLFLRERKMRTRLILQVHDELVFDACDEEMDVALPELVRIMEGQHEFPVPMKVNVSKGPNWLDMLPVE